MEDPASYPRGVFVNRINTLVPGRAPIALCYPVLDTDLRD